MNSKQDIPRVYSYSTIADPLKESYVPIFRAHNPMINRYSQISIRYIKNQVRLHAFYMYILQAHYTSSRVSTITLGDQSRSVSQCALPCTKSVAYIQRTLIQRWRYGQKWMAYIPTLNLLPEPYLTYSSGCNIKYGQQETARQPYFAFMNISDPLASECSHFDI